MIFSVIVPFFNEEKYIERCIRSLLDQDFDRSGYEIIFVDNNSTDRSTEIVGKYPEIKFLSESTQSAFAARNKALRIAKGDIIAFTDADCVVAKDWLATIYDNMKDPSVKIVLGMTCLSPDSSYMLRMIADYDNLRIKYIFDRRYPKNCYAYTRNMAVKSEMFKRLGYFIVLFVGADTEFLQRCIARFIGMKAIYLYEAKITHLEITSIWAWLKKNFIYARSNILVTKISGYFPADYKTNLKIFGQFMREADYGVVGKIGMFMVLVLSDLFYKIGMIVGFIRLKTNMKL